MKIKVGVLFGGKTTEHEVSIITAVQAMGFINEEKYEVIPIYLTKQNEWYTGFSLKNMDVYKDMNLLKRYCKNVVLYNKNGSFVLQNKKGLLKRVVNEIDIIMPIVHGYNMEDGNIQGYLETIGIPYTGSDIYGCTVGQDKVYMKQILSSSNVLVPKYEWFYDSEYFENEQDIINKVKVLGFPMIVKPSRQGSSIGITLVNNEETLKKAIDEAIKYDDKIIVEEVVKNLIELNCSVLGSNDYVETSAIEQVMGKNDFLTFEDKYIGNGAKKGSKKLLPSKGIVSTDRIIPANISSEVKSKIENMAKDSFRALGASGVVRIDFLMDKKTNKVYVNELNTIPGSLSFYLWNQVGKDYSKLLEDLINISIKRYKKKMKKTTSFDSNILSNFNGTKGFKGKL